MHLYSSYSKNNFGEVFEGMAFIVQPKLTVEIGLLSGYSAMHLQKHSGEMVLCDLFDVKAAYKHADEADIRLKFPNAEVKKLDYYTGFDTFKDGSIDLLHIDIGNTGTTYKVFLKHYYQKLSEKGIAILEGGSEMRDNYYWMEKYKCPKIRPIIGNWPIDYTVIDAFPSMTIVRK